VALFPSFEKGDLALDLSETTFRTFGLSSIFRPLQRTQILSTTIPPPSLEGFYQHEGSAFTAGKGKDMTEFPHESAFFFVQDKLVGSLFRSHEVPATSSDNRRKLLELASAVLSSSPRRKSRFHPEAAPFQLHFVVPVFFRRREKAHSRAAARSALTRFFFFPFSDGRSSDFSLPLLCSSPADPFLERGRGRRVSPFAPPPGDGSTVGSLPLKPHRVFTKIRLFSGRESFALLRSPLGFHRAHPLFL